MQLIVEVMEMHGYNALVMQTSMGALSNLCIDVDVKRELGKVEVIRTVFDNMMRHRLDPKVLTSACGLLTNLAYDESIAIDMAREAIPRIVCCMQRHPRDKHLQRNGAASLSNLSGTPHFVDALVSVKGIEALWQAIEMHPSDMDVIQLARGALNNISVNDETTSLHVAATFCKLDTTRSVICLDWDSFMRVDSTDRFGDTPLHAVLRTLLDTNDKKWQRLDVVRFLIACGASLGCPNARGESPADCIKRKDDYSFDYASLEKAIHSGQKVLKTIRKKMSQVLITEKPDIPKEICNLIAEYCHPLEISVMFRIEIEPTFQLLHSKASVIRHTKHHVID